MPIKDREDYIVIMAFIEYLKKHGYPCLQVDEWPEEKKLDSQIDAIAGHFAIEHTSIDTIPKQRTHSDWFTKVVDGINEDLSKKVSSRLSIMIEYTAVKTGQDWTKIKQQIKNWISDQSPYLADGCHVLNNIPGVPFHLRVEKKSDRPHGVFFSRSMPPYDNLSARVKTQLDGKVSKLSKHKPDKTTVLLIENNDFVMMNESTILDAIQKAYPDGPPSGVDQIWYADTSIPSEIEFSFIRFLPYE